MNFSNRETYLFLQATKRKTIRGKGQGGKGGAKWTPRKKRRNFEKRVKKTCAINGVWKKEGVKRGAKKTFLNGMRRGEVRF